MTAGRPRNLEHTEAAERAALELLLESGYAALSMDAISARSGVSKPALYRRWAHKGELLLDAFAAQAQTLIPLPDTGTLEGDLQAFLRHTFAALRGDSGPINRALVAEGLRDPGFLNLFRQRLIVRRREHAKALFDLARARGEIHAAPVEVLVDLLFGPMWYRLLIEHLPLDDAFADELARRVAAAARA